MSFLCVSLKRCEKADIACSSTARLLCLVSRDFTAKKGRHPTCPSPPHAKTEFSSPVRGASKEYNAPQVAAAKLESARVWDLAEDSEASPPKLNQVLYDAGVLGTKVERSRASCLHATG
mgnify:CR=1 FL=1